MLLRNILFSAALVGVANAGTIENRLGVDVELHAAAWPVVHLPNGGSVRVEGSEGGITFDVRDGTQVLLTSIVITSGDSDSTLSWGSSGTIQRGETAAAEWAWFWAGMGLGLTWGGFAWKIRQVRRIADDTHEI